MKPTSESNIQNTKALKYQHYEKIQDRPDLKLTLLWHVPNRRAETFTKSPQKTPWIVRQYRKRTALHRKGRSDPSAKKMQFPSLWNGEGPPRLHYLRSGHEPQYTLDIQQAKRRFSLLNIIFFFPWISRRLQKTLIKRQILSGPFPLNFIPDICIFFSGSIFLRDVAAETWTRNDDAFFSGI